MTDVTAVEFQIAKLQVRPGDMLVIRYPGQPDFEILKDVERMIAATFPGVQVLFLGPDADISVVAKGAA